MAYLTKDDMLRAAQGHPDAENKVLAEAGKLYRAYSKKLAYSLDSDDVAQDASIRLMKSLHKYDPSMGNPATYLIAVLRRQIIDNLRRRKASAYSLDAFETVESKEEAPCDRASRSEIESICKERLSSLRPVQRDALVSSYVYGLSRKKTGEFAKIPEGTIKTHVHRGLQVLKRDLEHLTT